MNEYKEKEQKHNISRKITRSVTKKYVVTYKNNNCLVSLLLHFLDW